MYDTPLDTSRRSIEWWDEPISLGALHRQEHDVPDAVPTGSCDQVTEIARELRGTQQEETVAVGQRGVMGGGVEEVEGHRLYARGVTPFRGSRSNVSHSRAHLELFDVAQRRNDGRADLTCGAGHEDASHYAALTVSTMPQCNNGRIRSFMAESTSVSCRASSTTSCIVSA